MRADFISSPCLVRSPHSGSKRNQTCLSPDLHRDAHACATFSDVFHATAELFLPGALSITKIDRVALGARAAVQNQPPWSVAAQRVEQAQGLEQPVGMHADGRPQLLGFELDAGQRQRIAASTAELRHPAFEFL